MRTVKIPRLLAYPAACRSHVQFEDRWIGNQTGRAPGMWGQKRLNVPVIRDVTIQRAPAPRVTFRNHPIRLDLEGGEHEVWSPLAGPP